jgi:hypothetical protein
VARLIDADALMKAIKSFRWVGVPNTLKLMFDYLKIIIRDQPTVDAVEVVRCKDCTRYKKGYCTIRKDGWGATLMVGMTDYCSDGERKDNEQT